MPAAFCDGLQCVHFGSWDHCARVVCRHSFKPEIRAIPGLATTVAATTSAAATPTVSIVLVVGVVQVNDFLFDRTYSPSCSSTPPLHIAHGTAATDTTSVSTTAATTTTTTSILTTASMITNYLCYCCHSTRAGLPTVTLTAQGRDTC